MGYGLLSILPTDPERSFLVILALSPFSEEAKRMSYEAHQSEDDHGSAPPQS